MNFKEYIYANPGIQHNVKAVIRAKMLRTKGELNEKEKEELDKKIKANMDLIKQYVENSYDEIDFDLFEKNIDLFGENLSNNYDATKSFKDNYNNALKVFDESQKDINENEQDSDENVNENEQDGDEKDEDVNENEQDNENEENDNKRKVKYSIKSDTYEILDEAVITNLPVDFYKKSETEKKTIYGENYDFIFKDIDNKKIKYHDQRLLFFLYQKFGKETARKYLEELSKGNKACKEELPYEMIYDMKDIKKSNNLTKEQKQYLLKVAKNNKRVATIQYGKSKLVKRILAAGAAVLAAGGIVMGVFQKKEEQKLIKEQTPVSDGDLNDKSDDKNKGNEDATKFSDKYKVTEQQIEQNVDNMIKNTDKDKKQQAMKNLKLGDVIELGEGINYSEDSLGGGEKGETGVTPWRPAGNYEINGISIIDSKNQIVTYAIDKQGVNVQEYIKKNLPENGRVAFHLNYLKDGERKPTGWADGNEIYEFFNEQSIELENER